MQQWGLKLNASAKIDNTKYTYINGGNKLRSVVDFTNDPTTALGDFKTSISHPQSYVQHDNNIIVLTEKNPAIMKDIDIRYDTMSFTLEDNTLIKAHKIK